ncbi:putative copper-importing P-type ATPase A [bacterium BMS3Bbin06]|nr:putative copper-importing P-type ATPase A [bacterium BMS3Bbin06]HDO35704.1 heavy metal translocating P-type ATPase [Nitrospirota bacterium]
MRSGEAFQAFRDVEKIVFDKTGTITLGRPVVTRVETFSEEDTGEILLIAASVERLSEHPVAKAVVREAGERSFYDVSDFREVPGVGVEAILNGERIMVTNPRFSGNLQTGATHAKEMLNGMESAGMTVSAVLRDKRLIGLIGISDRPRDDARKTIEALRRRGLAPVMLTGDNERTARTVASQVGIEEVLSEVMPDEKAERIRRMQSSGLRVAMVGDGINDAPALMQADIGIAIGAGTDIAIESADIILIRKELTGILSAYDLSVNTHRKIKQNLFWAFLFNGVGIPLATTGILHPIMAMSAMVLSTLAIMINSFGLRIKRIKKRADERP